MMLLTVSFDSRQVQEEEIARIEERIWNTLKLSGEYNRTLEDNLWVIHYVIEKKIREDSLQKVVGLEKAKEVSLREYTEDDRRSRRKKGRDTQDNDEDDDGMDLDDDEDDE